MCIADFRCKCWFGGDEEATKKEGAGNGNRESFNFAKYTSFPELGDEVEQFSRQGLDLKCGEDEMIDLEVDSM